MTIEHFATSYFSWLPQIRRAIKKEKEKTRITARRAISYEDNDPILELPEGIDIEVAMDFIRKWAVKDNEPDLISGKKWGGLYINNDKLCNYQREIMGMFCKTNALHIEFTAIRKFEAEIGAMIVKMLNGDENCCASTTSGGTESILFVFSIQQRQ